MNGQTPECEPDHTLVDKRQSSAADTANAASADSPRTEATDFSPTLSTGGKAPFRPASPIPVIAGFEVLEELGRGGMGVVYKARQTGLNRLVAVKVILNAEFAGEEELARFQREAEMAARIKHPNVVQVHEVGAVAGRPYLVMEWVDGGSLAAHRQDLDLSARTAAQLVETLARAVHAAHGQGIVHRDLKPGNVLLAREGDAVTLPAAASIPGYVPFWGVPKITDFGLAKQISDDTGLTQSGAVLGTPGYMAPEQAGMAARVGPAADTYALGAILYYLLTGVPPFHAATLVEVLEQVRFLPPAPPSGLADAMSCPRDLETICLKCLRKEPADRYSTAEALADDLRAFLEGRPIKARRVGTFERTWKWVKRRPALAAALMLTVIAILASGAGALWYWDAHYRVKIGYFNQFVRRWGAFEGVGMLTAEQARHRPQTYKLYARGGRVEKVESVNGFGKLTSIPDEALLGDKKAALAVQPVRRECSYIFLRDADGNVKEQVAYDRLGAAVWRLLYSTQDTAHFTDKDGFPQTRNHYGAAYLRFRRSPQGFDEELHFLDKNGKPRGGDDGAYGKRYVRDEMGLPAEIIYLGDHDQPMRGRDGYARSRQSFDQLGNLTRSAFFDEHDRPVKGTQAGFWGLSATYDEYGNPSVTTFLGADGRPLACNGVHGWKYEYGENGHQSALTYLDEQGKPVIHKMGGYARYQTQCDQQGVETEFTFFDAAGDPTRHREGYHGYTMSHNDHGDLTGMEFFDTARKPTLFANERIAAWRSSFDERGNLTEQTYLGVDGQLTLCKSRMARVVRRFEDPANPDEITAQSFYGLHNEPILNTEGVARVAYTYDERGNKLSYACYGLDGRATTNKTDGYSRWVAAYNERGKLARQEFFGARDEPVRMYFTAWGEPIAAHGIKVDKQDLQGKLFNRWIQEVFSRCEATYGPNDRCISRTFSDCDGSLGFTAKRLDFDENGSVQGEAFFDDGGRPKRHGRCGYARSTFKRDADGNVVEASYFDEHGKIVRTRPVVKLMTDGGQAKKIGLQLGDVLLRYQKVEIRSYSQLGVLRQAEEKKNPNSQIPMDIRRAGKTLSFSVSPGLLGVELEDRASAD